MSTDVGVDLVAYSPRTQQPLSNQVKTNWKPKPGGGRGRLAVDWWVPVESPAQYVAFVELSTYRVWLLSAQELAQHAQQRSGGQYHFYVYLEAGARPSRTGRPSLAGDFDAFLLPACAERVFG